MNIMDGPKIYRNLELLGNLEDFELSGLNFERIIGQMVSSCSMLISAEWEPKSSLSQAKACGHKSSIEAQLTTRSCVESFHLLAIWPLGHASFHLNHIVLAIGHMLDEEAPSVADRHSVHQLSLHMSAAVSFHPSSHLKASAFRTHSFHLIFLIGHRLRYMILKYINDFL